MLRRETGGLLFFNTSKFDFQKLRGDHNHIAHNLRALIKSLSPTARGIIEQFRFDEHIARLDEANLLYQVPNVFAEMDLHPEKVDNHTMGSVFDALLRRFNEKKNKDAGDHFMPREVIG